VKGKRIIGVLGDVGGKNAALPPLELALNAGCDVLLLLAGTCRTLHRGGKLAFDPRFLVHEVGSAPAEYAHLRQPHHLVVLGASQSVEGSTVAAGVAILAQAPVVAIQDMYGSSVPTLKVLQREGCLGRIACVCVTDEFSRQHLLSQGLEIFQDRVPVTGGPQFDKVIEIQKTWAPRRARIRGTLAPHDLLVLIAGQLNGTTEMLALVDAASLKLGLPNNLHVVLRRHPRSTELDQWLTNACLGRTGPRLRFYDVPQEYAPTNEDLLPGVDIVMSGYSTTNLYGVLYEIPGVVYVGTPSFRWDLWREKRLEKPPEVKAGAAWYVETSGELVHVITELQRGDASTDVSRLKEAQRRIAQHNDGHATDRVWAQMRNLLA
jgi:hypothetical protein